MYIHILFLFLILNVTLGRLKGFHSKCFEPHFDLSDGNKNIFLKNNYNRRNDLTLNRLF